MQFTITPHFFFGPIQTPSMHPLYFRPIFPKLYMPSATPIQASFSRRPNGKNSPIPRSKMPIFSRPFSLNIYRREKFDKIRAVRPHFFPLLEREKLAQKRAPAFAPSAFSSPSASHAERTMKSLPESLIEQVADYLTLHNMLAPAPRRIGVAVSGGADSVVLLHILHRLRSRFACDLHVLHINHHLRGDASNADESFVRALASEFGLPVSVEHTTPPTTQIEQQARDLRRAFFARALSHYGLHSIALGHTLSDQAETVLFRLLRGSGLTGLAAMRPVSPQSHLIRPLLHCTRSEIRAFAASQNIEWREDSSNLDPAFTRNRLRLETLPALAEAYNRNLELLLAQSASLAQTEEDYWSREINALYPNIFTSTPLGLQTAVDKIAPLHLALRRRIIRHAVQAIRGDLNAIEYAHIESILRLCDSIEGHNRVIIPGVDAWRSFDQLLLSPVTLRPSQQRDYTIPLYPGQECELPYHLGFLSVQQVNSDASTDIYANFKKDLKQKFEICDWNGDLLASNGTLPFLCVRNWRPGDVFQRVGHSSAEKIKSLFQSGKVLLWERKHWPVVQAGETIIWVRQFGGSAQAVASQECRNLVRLVYRPT